MRQTFLSKLHTSGVYFIISSLLLLLGAPLYSELVLFPQGYNDALASVNSSLSVLLWISSHRAQFLIYRVLLILAFALLFALPFTLFRIIVAQEILGLEEQSEESAANREDAEESEDPMKADGMPAYAWRGKGYAVIAAWAGFLGIIVVILGTLASTLYLYIVGSTSATSSSLLLPGNFYTLSEILVIIPNCIGVGLLAISSLLFGGVISRRGRNLWPGTWVAFSYLALATAVLLSASAVEVATSPSSGQHLLTTPAILLFALWVLWFGIMLVRLKPEVPN